MKSPGPSRIHVLAREPGDVPVPLGDARDHRETMERILDPFDASRMRPWPHVTKFLEEASRDGLLLDLAAGNGRHARAAARRGHRAVALDVAHSLLARARSRALEEGLRTVHCVEADALHLPFQDGVFANGVFAAGLHSIRGRMERRRALGELGRVMQPGGRVLVTVWWRDEDRFRGPLRRTDGALKRPNQGRERSVPPLERGDVCLPWKHGLEKAVPRFFHLYEEEELIDDLEACGFREIRIERVSHGSTWNLVARTVVDETGRA